ncbi:MAG: Holliday junction resolvase RuvX [Cyanobacteria bacterium P01_A01_bin.135]
MTIILGIDPGRDKCGVAVVQQAAGGTVVLHHDVVTTELLLSAIAALLVKHDVTQLVLGDQTTSAQWQAKLEDTVKLPITLVDERNSTLEARDRYWEMYPAAGLGRWVPKALRSIPGPVDGIVAILLVERYLAQLGP